MARMGEVCILLTTLLLSSSSTQAKPNGVGPTVHLLLPDNLLDNFGCLFGCAGDQTFRSLEETGDQTHRSLEEAEPLELTGLDIVPAKDFPVEVLQSGGRNCTQAGCRGQGLVAIPHPDSRPLLVLLSEDENNQTEVVVLGDVDEQGEIQKAGLQATLLKALLDQDPTSVLSIDPAVLRNQGFQSIFTEAGARAPLEPEPGQEGGTAEPEGGVGGTSEPAGGEGGTFEATGGEGGTSKPAGGEGGTFENAGGEGGKEPEKPTTERTKVEQEKTELKPREARIGREKQVDNFKSSGLLEILDENSRRKPNMPSQKAFKQAEPLGSSDLEDIKDYNEYIEVSKLRKEAKHIADSNAKLLKNIHTFRALSNQNEPLTKVNQNGLSKKSYKAPVAQIVTKELDQKALNLLTDPVIDVRILEDYDDEIEIAIINSKQKARSGRLVLQPGKGCAAHMSCVLKDECGPDGYLMAGRRPRSFHVAGRGMLQRCTVRRGLEKSDGFCCRTNL